MAEKFEKPGDWYFDPDEWNRETNPEKIEKLIELYTLKEPIFFRIKGEIKTIKPKLPFGCEHVTNGIVTFAVYYIKGSILAYHGDKKPDSFLTSIFGEAWAVCMQCDELIRKENDRIVICDDCGESFRHAEMIDFVSSGSNDEEESESVTICKKKCQFGEKHKKRDQY